MEYFDKFKNEMNLSGKNVYVGHRYVPKIDGDWDNSKNYEALTIVQYQGTSYTSRQNVPSGVEITNKDFWVVTGNYNAQIENYRRDVVQVADDMNALTELTDENFTDLNAKVDSLKITVNVKDFGAKGDGLTDDSYAFKEAIYHVLRKTSDKRDEKSAIYIPAGTYNIDSDRIFSDYDLDTLELPSSTRQGLSFYGDNRKSSVLKLITNGVEKWFYNNQSIHSQKFERMDFHQIGFTTDNPNYGNGFKQFSQGGEKQFRFTECLFNLGRIMQFEGTGNADLNRFLMCDIEAHDYAFYFNNNQAVATELITTDLMLRKGLVMVEDGGGGSFKVSGGSVEMYPHDTDTSNHYFFNMAPNPVIAQGNCDFNFNDLRFEMHGINKKLVNTTQNSRQLNVNFTRCQFGTVTGGSREVVIVYPTKRVFFDNCILNDAFTFKAAGLYINSSDTPSGGQLIFSNSDVGRNINLHERIVCEDNTYRVVANGCFRQSAGIAPYPITPQDFDFGWDNIMPAKITAREKIVTLKHSKGTFPTSVVSTEIPITLPKKHYIKKILIKKAPAASSVSSYKIIIGSDDKSEIIAETELAPHQEEHVIELHDVGQLDYNKLRIWGAGDAVVNQSAGVAYIEYI